MNIKTSNKIGHLTDIEVRAVELRSQGMSQRDVMAELGLNHSQVENAVMKATLGEADVARFEALGADLPSRVLAAREQKLSWGIIMILAGETEGKVRKAYEAATELKSKGGRIGKGGRFYYGEAGQPLYEDTLKPTGTAIPLGSGYDKAIALSVEQRIERLPREGVVRIAERYGVSTKGATAIIAKRVIKASRELAAKNAEREAKLAEATK